MLVPALDVVLDQMVVSQLGEGNKLPDLEVLQDG